MFVGSTILFLSYVVLRRCVMCHAAQDWHASGHQPEEEERMDIIIYNVRIIEKIDIDRQRER